jgi:hypothetical protein
LFEPEFGHDPSDDVGAPFSDLLGDPFRLDHEHVGAETGQSAAA